jgi:hypothetical protein
MTTPSVVLKAQKGPSTIQRAKFGPGMLLQSEDLEQLNSSSRDLSRLLFRSLFGCGVVCGLTVSAKTDNCGNTMVSVGAGLALNCIGDPIYVPKNVTFAATDGCDPENPPPNPLWVWLCSGSKCCAPRTPSCGCDDGDASPACTREVDWYEIHLGTQRPDCACGCELPPSPPKDPAQQEPPAGAEVLAGANVAAAAPAPNAAANPTADPCQCADPKSDCYKDHYLGVCGCKCDDSNCVVLALLNYDSDQETWTPDYRVRRFIRPVLVRDPLAVDPAAPVAPAPAAKKKAVAKKR